MFLQLLERIQVETALPAGRRAREMLSPGQRRSSLRGLDWRLGKHIRGLTSSSDSFDGNARLQMVHWDPNEEAFLA